MAKQKSSTEFTTVYEDDETKSIWTYNQSVDTNKSTLISVEYIYKNLPKEEVKVKKKKK